MARIVKRLSNGWIENNDAVYDDFSEGFRNNPRKPDGDVIRVQNSDGNTLLLKRHEIGDVLEDILNKVIEQKDIDLYKKINRDLRKHIDTNIEILNTETKKYFHDKIDKVAENIAIGMLDSEIEKQVRARIEVKLAEMRKVLDGR